MILNNMKKFIYIWLIFFLFSFSPAQAVELEVIPTPEFKPATLYLIKDKVMYRMGVHSKERADYYFGQGFKLEEKGMLGTSLTTINATDLIKDSRTTINNNFTALNNGKIEVSTTTLPYITTLSNLATVGTITSGVWNGTALNVNKGGTGTTTISQYNVLIGSSTNAIGIVTGQGTSGQFLTSNGTGQPPTWQSSAINQAADYDWTGTNTFATTTIATSTITSNTVASSTVTNLQILNNATINGWATASTSISSKGYVDRRFNAIASSTISTLQQSANTERSETGTSYVKVKEIQINMFGTVGICFDLKGYNVAGAALGRIYNNAVAVGTEQSTTSTNYVTYCQSITVKAGDLLQLYIHGTPGGPTYAKAQNFRLYYDYTQLTETTVNTD